MKTSKRHFLGIGLAMLAVSSCVAISSCASPHDSFAADGRGSQQVLDRRAEPLVGTPAELRAKAASAKARAQKVQSAESAVATCLANADVTGALSKYDELATSLGITVESAMKLSPFRAAEALLHAHRAVEAVPLLEEARNSGRSTAGAKSLLAWAYIQEGRVSDARSSYSPNDVLQYIDRSGSRFDRISPADPSELEADILLALGLAADFQARHGICRRYYEMSLELDPDEPTTLYFLARAYFGEARAPEAIPLLETALEHSTGEMHDLVSRLLSKVKSQVRRQRAGDAGHPD